MGVAVIKSISDIAKRLSTSVLESCMREVSKALVSSTQRKINSGIPPENAPLTQTIKKGNKTLRDNGQLLSSISAHNGKNWASVGTNLHYAKIVQEGGTVSGKKSGLWIPAGFHVRELMRKYNAQKAGELISAMKNAGWKIWRQGGVCWARKEKGQEITLFIIKKSVDIPSRPFMYLDEKDQKYIEKKVKTEIHNALKDG
ncbi:phage virion morphogenesis protein [Treponema pectinovorum]|uniref:phage virion morphogenesis protein n=1 Tax=Treponema pectinovorum TaxID=164 RepID=UPI0011C77054|nr:phage virion morphogenesis protein [Treponema pectinovorum]